MFVTFHLSKRSKKGPTISLNIKGVHKVNTACINVYGTMWTLKKLLSCEMASE